MLKLPTHISPYFRALSTAHMPIGKGTSIAFPMKGYPPGNGAGSLYFLLNCMVDTICRRTSKATTPRKERRLSENAMLSRRRGKDGSLIYKGILKEFKARISNLLAIKSLGDEQACLKCLYRCPIALSVFVRRRRIVRSHVIGVRSSD